MVVELINMVTATATIAMGAMVVTGIIVVMVTSGIIISGQRLVTTITVMANIGITTTRVVRIGIRKTVVGTKRGA